VKSEWQLISKVLLLAALWRLWTGQLALWILCTACELAIKSAYRICTACLTLLRFTTLHAALWLTANGVALRWWTVEGMALLRSAHYLALRVLADMSALLG